jgi:hypothetical protein
LVAFRIVLDVGIVVALMLMGDATGNVFGGRTVVGDGAGKLLFVVLLCESPPFLLQATATQTQAPMANNASRPPIANGIFQFILFLSWSTGVGFVVAVVVL